MRYPNISERSAPGLFLSIALLTFSLSALVQFLWQGTVLFMRDAGQPSRVIGLVFLAALPWVLRFLWAPLVDRHGSRPWGHYRGWIILTQIGITIGLAFLVANEPATSPYVLVAVLAALSAIMGTQQVAIFGLMATHLAERERPKAMTVKAVAFGAAGMFMGIGILYLLGDLGWTVTTSAIFVFTLLGLGALLPMKLDSGFDPQAPTVSLRNQFSVLRRARPRRLLLVSLAVNCAVATTYGLQSIMLIDAGFAISVAGLVGTVATSAIGMLGALATRYVVERLGGYMATGLLGVALGISCLLFAALISAGLDKHTVIVLLLVNSFLSFGLIPATKSILLGYCSEGRKATDFSVFSGIEALSFVILVSGSSAIADTAGFAPILAGAGCMSMIGAVLAWRQRQETPPSRLQEHFA